MVQSVAVFCGSKTGATPLYLNDAENLGKLLAVNNIQLIYGGGNKGLMGGVANAVLNNGGKVTDIIPKLLIEWEHGHDNLTEMHIVDDMHIRKRMMYEMCGAAVILPGGYGTLDEMFEMLTWNTLKIHAKKIILLNTAGFYDHLMEHIRKMTTEEFLYENWEERITVCGNAEEVIASLI